MTSSLPVKPTILIIRDGWGENHHSEYDACNAVKLAKTPCEQMLKQQWPHTEITACGLDVGLPAGVMGNSEVGHQNIGAGRIVDQEIVRINKAFATNQVITFPVIQEIIHRVKKQGSRLHLLGLVSDGEVHSSLSHLNAFLKMFSTAQIPQIYIHAITDGRDTPPTSGLTYIQEIEKSCQNYGIGKISTVCGRFWAMDRDQRWDRVQKAYDVLSGQAIPLQFKSAQEAIRSYYNHPLDESRVGDEFILPSAIQDEQGQVLPRIQAKDCVIFFNFRGDRPREITQAFVDHHLSHFNRNSFLNPFFVTLTEYQKNLCPHVIFQKPAKMKDTLGMYLSSLQIPQFRCAETEKYPHVTFFFNDYRDEAFPLEDRKLIPSPKDVTTYDQKPEMSAAGVAQATQEAIFSGKYGLIVVNFANADMVGHSGSLEAAIRACEAADQGVSLLLKAIDAVGGRALITADHGNADQMWDPIAKAPHTRHTLNPVEVILYGEGCKNLHLKPSGRLADIAPTLLELMGLPKPEAMTGESLIAHTP